MNAVAFKPILAFPENETQRFNEFWPKKVMKAITCQITWFLVTYFFVCFFGFCYTCPKIVGKAGTTILSGESTVIRDVIVPGHTYPLGIFDRDPSSLG